MLIANGQVGPCPNCGSTSIVSDVGEGFWNLFTKIIGPESSGSIATATNAVSTLSGTYYTGSANLARLRDFGVPEKYLKPLEDDIKRLYADKVEAEKKVEALTKPRELDEFTEKVMEKIDQYNYTILRHVQGVGLKVDATAKMIERLGQQVAKKEDVTKVERLILENREIFSERLIQNKAELIREIDKEIGEKVSREDKATLWRSLEKLSDIGGAVQFAEYVKKLIDFLNEKKVLQIVLPILIKIIFG
jgi:hypothetical protein